MYNKLSTDDEERKSIYKCCLESNWEIPGDKGSIRDSKNTRINKQVLLKDMQRIRPDMIFERQNMRSRWKRIREDWVEKAEVEI
jgi:hypothetical protein